MVDTNKTLVVFVVDESGSMEYTKKDAIGGFNRVINEQKKLPGELEVVMAKFNSAGTWNIVYDFCSIKNTVGLSEETYTPGGMTALYDAIGLTADYVGKKLANRAEHNRPGKVLFVIVTDGMENNSKEYARTRVKEIISTQRETYSWEFLFLGADQDAMLSGGLIGIPATNTFSFDNTSTGTKEAYVYVNSALTSYRSTGDVGNWTTGSSDE